MAMPAVWCSSKNEGGESEDTTRLRSKRFKLAGRQPLWIRQARGSLATLAHYHMRFTFLGLRGKKPTSELPGGVEHDQHMPRNKALYSPLRLCEMHR